MKNYRCKKQIFFFTITESFSFLSPNIFLLPKNGKGLFFFFHQNLSNTWSFDIN